ncbi:MAG: adenylate/guanylate cyclase domain-containing protein [Pseudomonadota bacterium]
MEAKRIGPAPGSIAQRLRLASGLVLFAFVLSHFLNHALGLWSIGVMEAVGEVRRAAWRSLPGSVLLYGAFLVHIALALSKTALRRTWRMPPGEALQLALGLAIPFLLIDHIVGTTFLARSFGVADTYPHVISLLWPDLAVRQTLLLSIVWVHSVIGLHYWLRPKAIYPRARMGLFAAAIMIPTLATLGWIEGARRLALEGGERGAIPLEAIVTADLVIEWGRWILVAMTVAALALGLAGAAGLFARSRFAVTYPGARAVRGRPGQTLLEVSREHGIAHAAVCGGRARCSTCRTRILSGGSRLLPPKPAEEAVLSRIHAPPDVRLACQIKPRADLEVQPLLPARDAGLAPAEDSYRWGVEQEVAILFVDMRGFTTLSEQRLPFDVVFILNEYLASMARAVRRNGGVVDKFIGDAVMAIYGITTSPETAARQALFTAADMVDAVAALNAQLTAQLSEPLRIGIGIHAGPSILGRIGTDSSEGLTALGDTVNTASRLEAATKELVATLVVSDEVARLADADVAHWRTERIAVRGREEHITVHAVSEADAVRGALSGPPPMDVPAAQSMLDAAGR